MQGILKKKPEEERWHGTYTDTGRMGSADGGKDTFLCAQRTVPGIAVSGRRILGACAAGGCVAAELCHGRGHLFYSTEQILRVFEKMHRT